MLHLISPRSAGTDEHRATTEIKAIQDGLHTPCETKYSTDDRFRSPSARHCSQRYKVLRRFQMTVPAKARTRNAEKPQVPILSITSRTESVRFKHHI